MSLHVRLNLAIGLLTLMIVGALIGAVLLDAQPRMKAENATMMRLIETTVTSSLVPITNAQDPRQELHRLVANLQSLRHVTVALASDPPAPNAATINPQAYGLLDGEPPAQVKIPVGHAG